MTSLQRPFKKKISITIDEDLLEVLTELAWEDGRNLSNYINYVLKAHATRLLKEKQPKCFILIPAIFEGE